MVIPLKQKSKMKNKFVVALILCLGTTSCFSQDVIDTSSLATKIDAQKTANSKDILTNLFRASIDNLLGDDRTYTLNSSFLGFYEIFNKKKPLPYAKERLLKQNSFDLGLKGDDQNNITKISGGFTISISNQKDITADSIAPEFAKLKHYATMFNPILREIKSYLEGPLKNDATKIQARIDTWNEAGKKHDFSLIHDDIKKALKDKGFIESFMKNNAGTKFNKDDVESVIAEILNGEDILHNEYQRVAKVYAQKLLWTAAPSVTYDRVNKQGEYTLGTNLTFGLWKKSAQKPWEFEIKSQFKIANDSTLTQANYNDKPLSFSIGLNKVLLQNKEKESAMELKVFTQYNHQFGSAPSFQREDIFTFNATLRVNVYKSFWLPLTLKYDVKNGNLLGLFTLTANLTK